MRCGHVRQGVIRTVDSAAMALPLVHWCIVETRTSSRRSLGKPPSDVASDLISDALEGGVPLLFRALDGSWVVEAPVQDPGGARKHGAGLLGTVADGDDIVEGLALEFLDMFGPVTGEVDADFSHDCDGSWIHPDGLRPRTGDFEAVAGQVAQPSFRDLAPAGIAGTQKQNSCFPHAPVFLF